MPVPLDFGELRKILKLKYVDFFFFPTGSLFIIFKKIICQKYHMIGIFFPGKDSFVVGRWKFFIFSEF